MMPKIYRSVPANTTEENPTWDKLTVPKGTLVQWVIFFDPEAANLLHVRIEYQKQQIMPWGGKSWIEGFFSPVPIEENIKIDQPPYVLDIYAYNDDDTFPHEYYIHPVLTTIEPVKVTEQPWYQELKRIFGFGSKT